MEASALSVNLHAARAARGELERLTADPSTHSERRMSAIAAGAIFSEALLAALHARFAELKSVAK